MGEIEQATKKLTTRLSEAATGSGSAVKALQRLHLTAAELQALPLDQRIVAIQEALNRFVPIPEVFKISDRVAMLANGVIVEAGATEEFVVSKNPVVRQFLQADTEGPLAVL
jgi:ABC-type proline/glycine betaine transport system ATPase subunit